MVYRPTTPPGGLDVDGLRRWTEDEFRNVSRGLSDFDVLQLNKNVVPSGPLAGMVAYADGTLWDPGAGEGLYLRTAGGVWLPLFSALPRSYLSGLTLSTAGASATFSCAAGVARDDTNTRDLVLGAALAKTTGAWAVGTGNGGQDVNSFPVIINTWYNAFLIKRLDTGVVDIVVSLSATAPIMPTGYTALRRIGSMKINAASQWTAFVQDGDLFQWVGGAVSDVAALNPGVAAVTRALSVPLGVITIAELQVGFSTTVLASNPASILISDLAVNDIAPTVANATALCYAPAGTANNYYTVARCRTNLNSQVRTRLQISDANIKLNVNTVGWTDARGRTG